MKALWKVLWLWAALAAGLVGVAHAATLLPNGEQVFLDNNGVPLASGKVYFYVPGTTTLKNTYQDSGASVLNTNPVSLDAAGRAIIYGTGFYRQVVQDVNGNTIWDQLTADTSSAASSWSGISTGSANAQVVTAGNFSSQSGQTISFFAGYSNSAGTTLVASGSAPIVIYKDTLYGVEPLTGGEIIAGALVQVTYDSTIGGFHLFSMPLQPSIGTQTSIASGSSVNLGSVLSHNALITGTTTITSFGSGATVYAPIYMVTFAGSLTLTYNATSMILPGLTNITTHANGTATVQYLGSGNWQVLNYSDPSGVPQATMAVGTVNNFVMQNDATTPNTVMDLTAASGVLTNSAGTGIFFSGAPSVQVNIGTVGANGLDVSGTIPANGWLYFYLMSNGSTVAGLASASASAPTLPTGYTYSMLVGAAPTASSIFKRILQRGKRTQYVVTSGSNTAALPSIVNGAVGNTATPTYVAESVSAFVPSFAAEIIIDAWAVNLPSTTYAVIAAPNGSYGAALATTNPPPIYLAQASNALVSNSVIASMVLESTNVYYASGNTNAGLLAMGWTVPLNLN